jgi:hypothetical protein
MLRLPSTYRAFDASVMKTMTRIAPLQREQRKEPIVDARRRDFMTRVSAARTLGEELAEILGSGTERVYRPHQLTRCTFSGLSGPALLCRRQVPGGTPYSRLKARLNAASDS